MSIANYIRNREDMGGFTVGQWMNMREIINHQEDYSDEWDTTVNWYDARLQKRYFEPMKRIELNAQGEGFSLATIHCSIIEHFASMVQGKVFNINCNEHSPSYEYKFSGSHFKNFIETYDPFREYFNSLTSATSMFSSADFYSNVRCALLHNACTKNNWRINTMSCGYANPEMKIMILESSGVKRLYRDVLTSKLGEFLQTYKHNLKENRTLRLYFARCIDTICEIQPDPNNFSWWNDEV
ncbi:hypothetical protein CEQ90_20330 [Lewinellaceae bacterium SD302]|nr:hypothetical protein CEQ90_20330 [Lewinellaceae bacterium SD302]